MWFRLNLVAMHMKKLLETDGEGGEGVAGGGSGGKRVTWLASLHICVCRCGSSFSGHYRIACELMATHGRPERT